MKAVLSTYVQFKKKKINEIGLAELRFKNIKTIKNNSIA